MNAKVRGRIGVFGGSFDPPHIGHLILAAEAQDQLGLEQVLFVLTGDPPHKQDRSMTPVEDRLAMLTAALDDTGFVLSRVEIDRPGPQYAVDTMKIIIEQYPQKYLIYLIGGDSLHDLPNWHRPSDFLAACNTLGVMRRPGTHIDMDKLESLLPGLRSKVEFIDAPLLEISSRELRQRVREDGHYRFYIPAKVAQRIEKLGLYR